MDALVSKAKRQNRFLKDTLSKRKAEQDSYERDRTSLPPAFNKRLFSVLGSEGVVITGASMDVMARNAANCGSLKYHLSASEQLAMKCVIEGLKSIHRGLAYVKEVLCHVVTLEEYEPMQYVRKKSNDVATYCYYILEGSVEATYDGMHGQKLQIYETDLLYTHRAGEYLGLVSESEEKDMAPPATIYNKEHTEMLRINRSDFHQRIDRLRQQIDQEKTEFINEGRSMLQHLPNAQKEEIKKFMSKEENGANQIVIKQNTLNDHVYFLVSGHCDCMRLVYLPTCGERVLLQIGHVVPGQFVGEERVLTDHANSFTVITKTKTVWFKVYRAAFETGGYLRNHLMALLRKHKPEYPTLRSLRQLGMQNYSWEVYKRLEATKKCTKDVHEDRQRVLQNRNLKFDDTNVMLNFLLKGEFPDRRVLDTPAVSLARFHSLLDKAALIHSTQGPETGEEEEEGYDTDLDDSGAILKASMSRPNTGTLKMYVTENKEVREARDLFKQFPGHIKPRDGMLKLVDIRRKPARKQPENKHKQMELVSMEPDPIVLNTRRRLEALAQKVAQRKQLYKDTEQEEDSPFREEYERAYTQELVARYRTNVLERKLRRSRFIHEDELKKMRTNHGKFYEPTDLNDDDKAENDTPQTVQFSVQNHAKNAEKHNELTRSKSVRRISIAMKRKQFLDEICKTLVREPSFPSLSRSLQKKEANNTRRRESLKANTLKSSAQKSPKSGKFALLKRMKTMPAIKLLQEKKT